MNQMKQMDSYKGNHSTRSQRGEPAPSLPFEDPRSVAEILKAMGHEIRLLILCELTKGTRAVHELEAALGFRQPLVSQQLSRLRAERLVRSDRDGRYVVYSLTCDRLRGIVQSLTRDFEARTR